MSVEGPKLAEVLAELNAALLRAAELAELAAKLRFTPRVVRFEASGIGAGTLDRCFVPAERCWVEGAQAMPPSRCTLDFLELAGRRYGPGERVLVAAGESLRVRLREHAGCERGMRLLAFLHVTSLSCEGCGSSDCPECNP